jgi:diaminopimelate decarboxylase
MPIPLKIQIDEIKNLVESFGTPLQVYDGLLMIENQKKFIKTMTDNFPNFRQYFAVKALPNPHILNLLIDNGSYLDCSSIVELEIAKKVGLKGSQIMFTSNYTSKEDLMYAKKLNAIINLDDISLINDLASLGDMPELLCFRLNPGIGKTDSETVSNILGGPNAKFGIPPFQIVEAFKKAKDLGVKKFGLHMMTGSNVLNLNYWDELIKILFENINKIKNELDIKLDFINIGGGLGIPYKPEQDSIDIEAFSNLLRSYIDRELELYKLEEPKLYMENGRFITGPYGWLIAKCNVIKNTYAKYCGLDASMSNLMRPGMYGSYHHITILGKNEKTHPLEKVNVVGTLCENNDWFAKDRDLPSPEVGDLFVIHDTGAHSHSMGFQYNGKLRCAEVMIFNQNTSRLCYIRRKETIDDYLSTITCLESCYERLC